jgi:hypothetical protein
MGKIGGMIGATMIYFCISSVISLALLLVYAKWQGYLAPEKVALMLAIARGEELPNTRTNNDAAPLPKPLTYEERDQRRAEQERHLELREQALRNELQLLAGKRKNLLENIEEFNAQKQFYNQNLEKLINTKEDEGRAAIRQIWESVKPKQAKELMQTMIDRGEIEEVSKIFFFMPIAKQAKIVAEFKSPEEQEKLNDLLRLLRLDRKSLPDFPLQETQTASQPADAAESR